MGGKLTETQQHRINLSEQVKLKALRETSIFKGLRADEVQELVTRAVAIRLPKGALIFGEGDPSDFFYVVQEGYVRLFKNAPSGKMLTFTVAGYGDTLNGLALSGDHYFMSAQTMTIVNVLRIPRKEFLAFVEGHPHLMIDLLKIIAERIGHDYARTVGFVGEDVEQRLLYSLYTLASRFGNTLSLTREELANFSGTTTETTIRVLSNLKKSGVISCTGNRGEIVISDFAKLVERLRFLPGLT